MYRADEEDEFLWYASISGPKGSPYENGDYFVELRFSKNFPFEVP